MDIKPNYIYDLLNNKTDENNDIEKQILYRKLLSTFDWYTLLKLVPKEILTEMLQDKIITKLYPKDITERYKYAREILSR